MLTPYHGHAATYVHTKSKSDAARSLAGERMYAALLHGQASRRPAGKYDRAATGLMGYVSDEMVDVRAPAGIRLKGSVQGMAPSAPSRQMCLARMCRRAARSAERPDWNGQ